MHASLLTSAVNQPSNEERMHINKSAVTLMFTALCGTDAVCAGSEVVTF